MPQTARKPLDVVEWFTYSYILVSLRFRDEKNGVEYWDVARADGPNIGRGELLSFHIEGRKDDGFYRPQPLPKKKRSPSTKKSCQWLEVKGRIAKVRPKKNKKRTIKIRRNKKQLFSKKSPRK